MEGMPAPPGSVEAGAARLSAAGCMRGREGLAPPLFMGASRVKQHLL